MTGKRLLIGLIVMGCALPTTLFFLLDLQRPAQFFTIAASTFLAWGVADFSAAVLARPRLQNRSPQKALQDWERQSTGTED